MEHTFTRQQLFDLVWSEPAVKLSKRLGMSDVGLAKICRKADILMPPRGYWAKLAAGQIVERPDLPRRTPGMSDRVIVGRFQGRGWDDEPAWLTEPDPPVPEFPESLDDVAARVRKQTGHVRRTTDLADAHTRIQTLLTEDERRREKLKDTPWNKPRFESPFEQRRLKILNSLCRALDRAEVRMFIRGELARDLAAHVGDRTVCIALDAVGVKRNINSWPQPVQVDRPRTTPMQFHVFVPGATAVRQSWTDSKATKLEVELTDIAVAIVVEGERSYRVAEVERREWIIKRKHAEERRRKEAERLRLECVSRASFQTPIDRV